MKIRTMPIGILFVGLLVALVCSLSLVPHRGLQGVARISTVTAPT